jgi:hypothetical protein
MKKNRTEGLTLLIYNKTCGSSNLQIILNIEIELPQFQTLIIEE